MNNIIETNSENRPHQTWLHRLVRMLPTISVVVLVGLIVVLAVQIKSEGKSVKERASAELRRERPKTNVVTMELVPDHLQERLTLPGYVQPWVSLTLVAEVKGTIVEKRVSEGSRVKKGDIIARIDERDYKNAYASAKASYEVARTNQVRLTQLFRSKAATQAQIDDISASASTSKAAMDNAALALERCTIRAPMNGIIDRMHIEQGQFMDAGKPVADLIEIDRVKVVAGIPESDVDAVRRLEQFTVTVDALGGRTFQGTRHYLTKTSDNFARLYNLEIAVDNPAHEILPDMFARVSIVKTEVANGLAVPLYAVIQRNEMNNVFVAVDGTAHLRPVQLGIQDGWRMEVRNGLSQGDQVVVVGQRSIDDGEPVNVTRTVHTPEELIQ